MSSTEEIKKALKEKKAVIGTKKVMKKLRSGQLSAVYITSNCPEKTKKDIEYYAGLSNTKTVQLKRANDELGVLCKKPFSISILGIGA